MTRQGILQILLAGTFGALAATGSVQAIAATQDNAPSKPNQADTEQGRSPAANENRSGDAQNPGNAMQSQGDQGATDKTEGSQTDKSKGTQNSKNNPQKHPPTSVMDRATPSEKTPDEQSARKHPPTSVMNRETPEQKSPGTPANESETGSGASTK